MFGAGIMMLMFGAFACLVKSDRAKKRFDTTGAISNLVETAVAKQVIPRFSQVGETVEVNGVRFFVVSDSVCHDRLIVAYRGDGGSVFVKTAEMEGFR